MAKYMIHACPKRMWYIEQYLIPGMLKQGIKDADITVYNDTNNDGNLESCLKSFLSVPENSEGTWHLQDDVLVSSLFKNYTEKYDEGIVYGFSGYYDKTDTGIWYPAGYVPPAQMWTSFQCVRIPNQTAHDFVKWFEEHIRHNPVYKDYVQTNSCDDWFFKLYCQSELKYSYILNLAPNIVEHIDQLIGGSIINKLRENPIYRSRFWEEEELYEELKEQLNAST